MLQDNTRAAWPCTGAIVAAALSLAACGGNTPKIAFEPLETASETKAKAPPPPSFLPPEEARPTRLALTPPLPEPQIPAPLAPTPPVVSPTPAQPAQPAQTAQTVQPAPAEPAALPVEPTAPAPVASAPASATTRQAELADTIETWRSAWAARNIDRYLDCYVPEFKGQAATAEVWRAARKRILGAAGPLEIRLYGMKVLNDGPERIELSIEQSYRSASLADTGRKTLILVRRDQRWLIAQESFVPDKP